VDKVCEELGVSQRRACQVLGQHRAVQRYKAKPQADNEPLTEAIISLARQYGRYRYRRISVLLKQQGWQVNVKRSQRIWRRVGLTIPQT